MQFAWKGRARSPKVSNTVLTRTIDALKRELEKQVRDGEGGKTESTGTHINERSDESATARKTSLVNMDYKAVRPTHKNNEAT